MADDDKRTADERKREAHDAEQKRVAQAEEDRKAKEQAEADRRKQARDAPLVPNDQGIVMVEAIMGPYRGQRLQMKEADGTAAIGAHWARNPTEAEYQHDELSEEERKAAWDASHKWANDTWEEAQKEPDETPPPEGGAARKRAMTPEPQHGGAGYATRAAPAPAPGTKR
jgi:hypothetical protein